MTSKRCQGEENFFLNLVITSTKSLSHVFLGEIATISCLQKKVVSTSPWNFLKCTGTWRGIKASGEDSVLLHIYGLILKYCYKLVYKALFSRYSPIISTNKWMSISDFFIGWNSPMVLPGISDFDLQRKPHDSLSVIISYNFSLFVVICHPYS